MKRRVRLLDPMICPACTSKSLLIWTTLAPKITPFVTSGCHANHINAEANRLPERGTLGEDAKAERSGAFRAVRFSAGLGRPDADDRDGIRSSPYESRKRETASAYIWGAVVIPSCAWPKQRLDADIREGGGEGGGDIEVARAFGADLEQHRDAQLTKALGLEVVPAQRPQITERGLRIGDAWVATALWIAVHPALLPERGGQRRGRTSPPDRPSPPACAPALPAAPGLPAPMTRGQAGS